MSAPQDTPWKAVGVELLALGDSRVIERLLAVINAARAAEATQHRARLAVVEAERDRLQRVNECVYEVCGCGNMADAHCMICCRPLTEHRLIPTRELAEIQRRFALYAEDLAERDRLKAALSTAAFALDLAGFRRDRDAAYAALTPQGQSTDGETR